MIRHKIYQILIIIFALTLSACEETFVEAFGVENPSGEVVPPQEEPDPNLLTLFALKPCGNIYILSNP